MIIRNNITCRESNNAAHKIHLRSWLYWSSSNCVISFTTDLTVFISEEFKTFSHSVAESETAHTSGKAAAHTWAQAGQFESMCKKAFLSWWQKKQYPSPPNFYTTFPRFILQTCSFNNLTWAKILLICRANRDVK